jgi:hypothetical protein
MRRARAVLILFLVASAIATSAEPVKLTAAQAKDYVGEFATVCGTVANTKYALASRGRPTFLNLGRPYPNQLLAVVIWQRNRPKFDQPEVRLQGKDICVTGLIESYRGVPQIEGKHPDQIQVQR